MMNSEVKLTLIQNGPLKVEGEVLIVHPDGKEEKKSSCYICRCGKSNNKPWCDGSHAK
ncbi:MAG TPA: CDGSH iron-sulfur domain-containing protein [Bacteroidales bacterium]|jgi:CDGSH-type Zn-finger protein|nr:CDGSH iron-sulfur domain-containing protein [Bacteroidales bacterium]